jgi:hypothetical protein
LIVTIKAVAKIIDVFAFMPSKRLGIVGVLPKQFIPIRMKFLLMEGA